MRGFFRGSFLPSANAHLGTKRASSNLVRSSVLSNAQLLAVILAAGLSASGCHKSSETTNRNVQPASEYNYPYDKRQVFIDDASADLTELDQRINELSTNALAASPTVKATAQSKIEDVRNQRAAMGNKLIALKSATVSNWNELKSDYQDADFHMKVSLRESWQWIKKNTHS